MTPLVRMVQMLFSNEKSKLVTCGSKPEQQSIKIDEVISNEYLLRDILLRVPPKALVSFIIVSKQWFSIISDPEFCTSHARRNAKISLVSGLYIYRTREARTQHGRTISVFGSYQNLPALYFPELGCSFNVLDSCNGLLLCLGGLIYAVCNPTTRKYKVLPQLDDGSLLLRWSVCLGFDPSKSPHYMVILVACCSNSYRIDIYSSVSSSWRRVVVPSRQGYGRRLNGIIFWNGYVHWITDDDFQIQFNADSEVLIATPKLGLCKYYPNLGILYFGECGGRLILIHRVQSPQREYQIREMSNNSKRWTVMFNFNFWSLAKEVAAPLNHFLIPNIVKGEDDDDFSLVVSTGGKLKLYNLKRKVVTVLGESRPPYAEQSANLVDFAYPFLESLSPV